MAIEEPDAPVNVIAKAFAEAWHEHPDATKVDAQIAADAIPDGWAKVDGEWIRLRPRTPDNGAGRRLYEEV